MGLPSFQWSVLGIVMPCLTSSGGISALYGSVEGRGRGSGEGLA